MDPNQKPLQGDVQAAVAAGAATTVINDRLYTYGGEIPLAISPQGKVEVLQDVLAVKDQRADAPRRLKGTAQITEVESFIDLVNRFKDGDSAIFADVGAVKLTAVFNYHPGYKKGAELVGGIEPDAPAAPRWSDHRAVYACPLSAEWQLWTKNNEKWMTQEAFGQFLEDNLRDLAAPCADLESDKDMPAPARVLDVARNLIVHASHQFERTINPSTGEGTFLFKKDNDVKGTTKVPKSFLLGIPVFEAGDPYRVEARLRYTVDDGKAKFQYALCQPQVTLRDAFNEVRKKVQEKTGLPLFAGAPQS